MAFKKQLVEGYDNRFVLNQLYGKQKAKNKFPYLFENPKILYPKKVSIEQSSSEKTAVWKAKLVSGDSLLDMTGGFGVDTHHFSKIVQKVTYLEKNTELYDIVKHNFEVLEAKNITIFNEDSINYLKNTKQKFDWIYLDPARRDEEGNRKIGLKGYLPNLLEIKDLLFEKAENILIKVSPMLDIKQAIQQLETVQKVIVLAVQNEVKELLFVVNPTNEVPLIYQCVDLRKNNQEINYQSAKNRLIEIINYASPKTYIYEPNATILKAGLFNEIAIDYNLAKLHPNTHLYTSHKLDQTFPGRIFLCKAVESFNKKAITPYLNHKKANITTRNFPYSVSQIKKKLGLKDGGNNYIFATTLQNNELKLLLCEKYSNHSY